MGEKRKEGKEHTDKLTRMLAEMHTRTTVVHLLLVGLESVAATLNAISVQKR